MSRHRFAALRIRDVGVTHRRGNALVPQDALHVGQVYAWLQQVRGAAVPELMEAHERDLSTTSNAVDAVADHLTGEPLAAPVHEQRGLTQSARALQHVVPLRQIRLQTSPQDLRHRYATFAPGL